MGEDWNKDKGDEMNKRLKSLRKTLGLTQDEFAKRTGVSRPAIANFETGRNNASGLAINAICKEFNVNEHWLRTGEGDMFVKSSRSDEIAAFVDKLLVDDSNNGKFKRDFISILCRLNEQGWDALLDMARMLKDAAQNDEDKAPLAADKDVACRPCDGTIIYYKDGQQHVEQLTSDQMKTVVKVIQAIKDDLD